MSNSTMVSSTLGQVVNVTNAPLGRGTFVVIISVARVTYSSISVVDTIRFVVSADVFVRLRGSHCRDTNVTLAYESFLLPLIHRPKLQSTVQAVVRVSTIASSLTGNPVTAMSNTGMVSILELLECLFSDVDPLDPSVSPLGLAYGNSIGQYYRGAIISALCVYAIGVMVGAASATVAPKLVPGMTAMRMMGLLRFPSSMAILIGMFHMGMVTCSVSLLLVAIGPFEFLLGTVGILTAVLCTVFTWLAGTQWNQCDHAYRDERELQSKVAVVQWFLKFSLWDKHWVERGGETLQIDSTRSFYKRRYVFILDDMATAWWTGMELLSGIVVGAILGVRRNDIMACRVQRFLLAAQCLVMLVLAAWVRPCGSLLANVFLILSKLGSLVIALMILVHTELGSDWAEDGAQFSTACFGFVATLQAVLQLVLAAVLARKSLLAAVRRLLRRPRERDLPETDRNSDNQDLDVLLQNMDNEELVLEVEQVPLTEDDDELALIIEGDELADDDTMPAGTLRDSADAVEKVHENAAADDILAGQSRNRKRERKRSRILKEIQRGLSDINADTQVLQRRAAPSQLAFHFAQEEGEDDNKLLTYTSWHRRLKQFQIR